jgi:hypothetical protein
MKLVRVVQGWMFYPEEEGCTEDTAAGGIKFIRELYEREGSSEKSVRGDAAHEGHCLSGVKSTSR